MGCIRGAGRSGSGWALALLASPGGFGCGQPDIDVPVGTARANLSNPIAAGHPPAIGSVGIAVNVETGLSQRCHGTLVHRDWLLLAAHCFHGVSSSSTSLRGSTGGFSSSPALAGFGFDDVHLHPQALRGHCASSSPCTRLSEVTGTIECAGSECPSIVLTHDLALARLTWQGGEPPAPAKLWKPAWDSSANAPAQLPIGSALTLGGFGPDDQAATGRFRVVGLGQGTQIVGAGNPGWLLAAAADPSSPEPGDSGSGVLATAPLDSIAPLAQCTVAHGNTGETVLVGVVNSARAGTIAVVPTWLPEHADWIATIAVDDRDGDALCDDDDLCPDHADQRLENSNELAEEAWGSLTANGTKFLADACDPAPVPKRVRTFAAQPLPPPPGFARLTNDALSVEGTLKEGEPLDDTLGFRYCVCRDAETGKPLADMDQCADPPFHCGLGWGRFNLTDEVSSVPEVPGLRQTTWRRITVIPQGFATCPLVPNCTGFDQFPISFPSPASRVGRWDFRADNERWLAASMLTPVPVDPRYPAGADLGGVLWTHGNTRRGAVEHGLPSLCIDVGGAPPTCGIADHFTFGFAPDQRIDVSQFVNPIPITIGRPPVVWPFPCVASPCPPSVEVSIDPGTLATVYWLGGGFSLPADDFLSLALRQSFMDATARWVTASEPGALSTPALKNVNAVLLAADGSSIRDALLQTNGRFGLATGEGVEAAGMTMIGSRAALLGTPPPRSGFAAVYSRLKEVVAIAGGRLPSGEPARDLWVFRNPVWRGVTLGGQHTPINVESATYAFRDSRLWLIDDVRHGTGHGFGRLLDGLTPGTRHARWLYRIDPESGRIETARRLHALDVFDHVWLLTTEDGRIVLAAADGHPSRWVLALLEADPFSSTSRIKLLGVRSGRGQLASTPQVLDGVVSGGIIREMHGTPLLFVEVLGNVQELRGHWHALKADVD